jgi:type VI protein secretion system component VasK
MDWFWSFFWWWFAFAGIGGTILAIVFWPLIAGTKIGRMLLAIGAAVLGALAMLARARQQGADAERKRQEKENADFLEAKRRRDADIDRLNRDDLERMLTDRSEQPGNRPGD